MNNSAEQRIGMCAYQRAMIKRYEGDLAGAKVLMQKAQKFWPENLNIWVELDFMK